MCVLGGALKSLGMTPPEALVRLHKGHICCHCLLSSLVRSKWRQVNVEAGTTVSGRRPACSCRDNVTSIPKWLKHFAKYTWRCFSSVFRIRAGYHSLKRKQIKRKKRYPRQLFILVAALSCRKYKRKGLENEIAQRLGHSSPRRLLIAATGLFTCIQNVKTDK